MRKMQPWSVSCSSAPGMDAPEGRDRKGSIHDSPAPRFPRRAPSKSKRTDTPLHPWVDCSLLAAGEMTADAGLGGGKNYQTIGSTIEPPDIPRNLP